MNRTHLTFIVIFSLAAARITGMVPLSAAEVSEEKLTVSKTAELSSSEITGSEQMPARTVLALLRIRFGEQFSFAQMLTKEDTAYSDIPDSLQPESSGVPAPGEQSSPDSALQAFHAPTVHSPSLNDYRELPGMPLPALPRDVYLLAGQLTAAIESYSGYWSVYIKNITTGDTVLINDMPMKSASIMKLFIMGTVYESFEQGFLERTSETMSLMENMISYSSNEAANKLLLLLGEGSYQDGINRVNRYIRSRGYSDLTHEYNGFNNSSTVLDKYHLNQVSAKDCGDLLEQIYHRTFGSRLVCNEIETMLLKQNTRYKIPKALPEGTQVGNKTGEMDSVENDVAIIYGPESDYILCILSEDWEQKDDAQHHIQELSSIVYRFFSDYDAGEQPVSVCVQTDMPARSLASRVRTYIRNKLSGLVSEESPSQ